MLYLMLHLSLLLTPGVASQSHCPKLCRGSKKLSEWHWSGRTPSASKIIVFSLIPRCTAFRIWHSLTLSINTPFFNGYWCQCQPEVMTRMTLTGWDQLRYYEDQDQDGTSWSCSQAFSKPVWHIPLLCVQWKTNDDEQRNCPKHAEFHSKNKFENLLHLVGFIIRNHTTNLLFYALQLMLPTTSR